MTTRRRAAGPVAAACALLAGLAGIGALGGCSRPHESAEPSTVELRRTVEAIDGVVRVEVTSVDDLQQGVHHEALVIAAAGADAVCLVDRTLAALHHEVDGTLIVTVRRGATTADARDVGFVSRVATRPGLDERYGATGAASGDAPAAPTCDPLPAG